MQYNVIPQIREIHAREELEALIEELRDQYSIDPYHVIRIVPEKDELLVGQIKELPTIIMQYQDKQRLVVLDSVDNSGPEVQNALLKILEEGNEHILFVLTVLEPQRLLPTIMSRCAFFPKKVGEKKQYTPPFPMADLSDATHLRKNMNTFSSYSKEDTLSFINELLLALPHTPLLATQKNIAYILHVRRLIMNNNVNHLLGIDSILIFLAEPSSMKEKS